MEPAHGAGAETVTEHKQLEMQLWVENLIEKSFFIIKCRHCFKQVVLKSMDTLILLTTFPRNEWIQLLVPR